VLCQTVVSQDLWMSSVGVDNTPWGQYQPLNSLTLNSMNYCNIFWVANFSAFARFEFLTVVLMRIQIFWDLMFCCWKDEWFPAFQGTIVSSSSWIMHKEEIFLDCLILEDDGAMIHRGVKNHSSSNTLPLSYFTVTAPVFVRLSVNFVDTYFLPLTTKH